MSTDSATGTRTQPADTQPADTRSGVVAGGIGTSPVRPDATLKVRGEFAYSSDMWLDDMLWGATLRSPHPRARIVSIDLTEALKTTGVHAVLTAEDVPGVNRYGLEIADQPVLAEREVRYQGEAVAIVAADHPEIARQACKKIAVHYEVLAPITDPVAASAPDSPLVHATAVAGHGIRGNVLRSVHLEQGSAEVSAAVVVTGEYQVGMQDQAFLGPESGLAVPAEDGGVDLYIATQWLHADQAQVATALGLPTAKVRFSLAGVGGAFGGREDVSMQIHACLLALRTGRPIKMVYSREESFYGHVHRHPALLRYEHGADSDGRLVYARARIVLDGGAYASSSTAVAGNAATLGFGPYEIPNLTMDCLVTYTNNPPCGAMRGFGAVQACFAYESQMDKLAQACGLSPVELRLRNAMSEGSVMPTGQLVDSAAPVAELLRRVRDAALPAEPVAGPRDVRELPGGVSNTTHGEGVSARRRLCHRHQERRVLRGIRRLLDRSGAAGVARRGTRRLGADRRRRGGPGPGDAAAADRAHRTRGDPGDGAAGRHQHRIGGVHLGLAAVLRHRRRGPGGLPGGAGQAGRARWPAGRRADR